MSTFYQAWLSLTSDGVTTSVLLTHAFGQGDGQRHVIQDKLLKRDTHFLEFIHYSFNWWYAVWVEKLYLACDELFGIRPLLNGVIRKVG